MFIISSDCDGAQYNVVSLAVCLFVVGTDIKCHLVKTLFGSHKDAKQFVIAHVKRRYTGNRLDSGQV